MIKTKKGVVRIKGDKLEISADLVCVVRSLRDRGIDKENIIYFVNLAFMTDKEIKQEFKKQIEMLFKTDEQDGEETDHE